MQELFRKSRNAIADFLRSPFSKTIGILFGVQAMAMLFAIVHSTFNRFTYEKHIHGANTNEKQLKNTCDPAQPVEFDLIQATAHAAAYKLGLYDVAGTVGSKIGEAMGRNFTKAITWRAQAATKGIRSDSEDSNASKNSNRSRRSTSPLVG
ncbi:MAG TPA: hypothetical protein VLG38_06295 [Gammaproteobacteria bacterium]|nr:hypothetical protein [Gammaproteobacteria bacterium]